MQRCESLALITNYDRYNLSFQESEVVREAMTKAVIESFINITAELPGDFRNVYINSTHFDVWSTLDHDMFRYIYNYPNSGRILESFEFIKARENISRILEDTISKISVEDMKYRNIDLINISISTLPSSFCLTIDVYRKPNAYSNCSR